jgi:aspartyl-tRNA(Asn)/glutamyl-tRNA(Gln) amidotransferase subunit A
MTDWSIAQIASALRRKDVSCREVTEAHLARIAGLDEDIGAFLHVNAEGALAAADRMQARLDSGDDSALLGIPVAVKDNISTAGVPTTCASRILEGYVPPFNATVMERLDRAGSVLIGKTNMDEFAMGSSTETSAYKLCRNPRDTSRSPGGSSGGSAAAVAAGMAPISIGSDTGGSIRQPASLCGVVGFKPTYGRVSRYGLIAFGSSLDQIGPFGRNVEDVARLASAISGHDPLDSTSIAADPIDISSLKTGSLKGLRVALPDQMFGDAASPEVRSVIESAIESLAAEGVQFSHVSIPSIELGVTTYYIIAPAEASSNLARFDGIRYGPRLDGKGHINLVEATRGKLFGHEVKSRIMIGTYALSAGYYDAFYVRAQQVRAMMRQEFDRVFQEFDLVLSPTSPITAFRTGDLKDDPMALKLLDYCTIPANMGGMPGISINAGYANVLPVGLQLMAAPLEDSRLLQSAFAVEKALSVASDETI